ncbi:hypothetical protein Dip510_001451 [Elusimicrobium posterum]|uniref:hypothetical protein n=1 Tax=Elusimicrobium posterum TaxID=3116653 RepID=UPI003C70794A
MDYSTKTISWRNLESRLNILGGVIGEFREELFSIEKTLPSKEKDPYNQERREYSEIANNLFEANRNISNLAYLSKERYAKLSNTPFLLLSGQAGAGKTHLLCDFIENNFKKNEGLSFLFFGRDFHDTSFWGTGLNSIFKNFSEKNKNNFLKELNENAKTKKCRNIIVIDAINETINSKFWKQNLPLLIKDIKKHSNLGLIISIRSSFSSIYLTKKIRNTFIEEEHRGFGYKTIEACNKYLGKFSIPIPETPVFNMNFSNPLFLYLFCRAFQKRNQTNKEIFRGHEGFTYIFETFVRSVTKAFAERHNIPLGKGKNIWDKVIEKIAEEMVNSGTDRILESQLIKIVEDAFPTNDSRSLIQDLESNVVINRIPSYRSKDIYIVFPFQKFSDHLIARYIFKEYYKTNPTKNLRSLKIFFNEKSKFGQLLSKKWDHGLIEALSIQLPERFSGIEFFTVIPHLYEKKSHIIIDSFLESITARKATAFSKNRKHIFNFIDENNLFKDFMQRILGVSGIPEHPFNANFLHKTLMANTMPDRDAYWISLLNSYISRIDEESNILDVIIDWGLNFDFSNLEIDKIHLHATMFTWFLASSSKHIRNRASRALVRLYQNSPSEIIKNLNKFKDVDDMYIKERLIGITYGIVLRNREKKDDIKKIAKWIIKNIFSSNYPPKHLLLRDYAQEIVRIAIYDNILPKKYLEQVFPPYKTPMPSNIPSREYLEKKKEDMYNSVNKDEGAGIYAIWYEVMSSGDFARKTIGTDKSSFIPWSKTPIASKELSPYENLEKFKKMLSKKELYLFKGIENKSLSLNHIFEKVIQKKLTIWDIFEFSLTEKKRIFFKGKIKPFLNQSTYNLREKDSFDPSIIQRFIFNKILEMGYSPKKHGRFDYYVNQNYPSKDTQNTERIGAKYQWIAYHEILAIISDNFKFRNYYGNGEYLQYNGAYDIYARDFDPSYLPIETNEAFIPIQNFKKNAIENIIVKNLKSDNWIKKQLEFIKINNFVEIKDDNGEEWISLYSSLDFKGENNDDDTIKDYKKTFWILNYSYLVKNEESEKLFNWMKKQDFSQTRIPERISTEKTFLGEIPFSTVYTKLYPDNYNDEDFFELEKEKMRVKLPFINYFWSSSNYEYSNIEILNNEILKEMGLTHKKLSGLFYKDKTLVAANIDISENKNELKLFLINKKYFLDFLKSKDYSVVWVLQGEKMLTRGLFDNGLNKARKISGCAKLNAENNFTLSKKLRTQIWSS